jgi:hypothetical protein
MHDLVHGLFLLDDNPRLGHYFIRRIVASSAAGILDQEPSRGVQILDVLDDLPGYHSLFLLFRSVESRIPGSDDVTELLIAGMISNGEAAAKKDIL